MMFLPAISFAIHGSCPFGQILNVRHQCVSGGGGGVSGGGGGVSQSNDLIDIILRIGDLFRATIPVLITLGVIYFIWGVIQYMIGDSEEAKTKGRDTILYGIIGLTVIIAMWGLVFLFQNTFGLSNPRNNLAPIESIDNLSPR